MTKPVTHVEPTSGTNYQNYLWPRSKDPRKDALYLQLHDLSWRFDSHTSLFWTPEDWPLREAFGRLEYDADCTVWARIQPPSSMIDGRIVRAEPLLVLDLTEEDS
jgi:hypothetical protein